MTSTILFILTLATVCFMAAIIFFDSFGDAVKYLRSRMDVARGIVVVLLISVLLVLIASGARAEKGTWFSYVDYFMGLEYPAVQSPQCWAGEVDDKLTSNVGINANIYQSGDKRFYADFVYRHHSCAFNEDRFIYDAPGFELRYRLWQK